MHRIKPYLLFLFTIPVIIFTLYSCATKPNIPYPGKMSENFSKLEQRNPLLAMSDPKEKDIITKIIVNLINKDN